MTFTHQGDDVAYSAAHLRIATERGPASEYDCTCGKQAGHWSYRGGSPRERVQLKGYGAGCLYSPDPSDYDPMCVSCHKRKDMERHGRKSHCIRGHEKNEANTGSQGGCLICKRGRRKAKELGVVYHG